MMQNNSDIISYYHNQIISHQQQLDNFNNKLENEHMQASSVIALQFEQFLLGLENTPSTTEDSSRKQFKAKVISLNNPYVQKLLSTAQTLLGRKAKGFEEEDASIKAKRLLAIVNHSLDFQMISPELRKNYSAIAKDLVQFIAKHEPKPTFKHSSDDIQSHIIPSSSASAKTTSTNTPAHFSIVGFTGKILVSLMSYLPSFSLTRASTTPTSTPAAFSIDSLPEEVAAQFMSFLEVKDLGRIAQVSKAFYAASHNERIWEKKCRNQPKDVNMTLLSANQNSYKLLYKNETDLTRFVKYSLPGQIKDRNRKTKEQIFFPIYLNWRHPELKAKHVKQLIKKTVLQNPSNYLGMIDADTPLSHIRLYCDGEIQHEMLVQPFDVYNQKQIRLEVRAPNTLDYDNIAAAINQSSEPNSIRKEQLETFDKRGGILKMCKEDVIISLDKSDQFITGCSTEANRSQVARDFLLNKGCNVIDPLAGGEEGVTDFFSQLSGDDYHFICFSHSAASVIRHLLDRPGNLDNFTVTFIPWQDEIAHPPAGIAPYSKEAYKAVYDKLERSFSFLD